jgi:hypothetical protein
MMERVKELGRFCRLELQLGLMQSNPWMTP